MLKISSIFAIFTQYFSQKNGKIAATAHFPFNFKMNKMTTLNPYVPNTRPNDFFCLLVRHRSELI